jgi:hypothetical protein
MNVGIIILIVLGQLLGKSLIKKLWSYFLCLQVALVTYENNRSNYPPNIAMSLDTISGILSLGLFPKDLLIEKVFG